MSTPVPLRSDFDAIGLRILARRSRDPDQTRRLLALAEIFGAYQAVAWALALKVLPSAEAAGKDMGIWHISMVLPQILGPAVTGWMISVVKASFGDPTAYATAFGIGALWLMLSAALVTCVRLPVPVGNQIRTAIEQRN